MKRFQVFLFLFILTGCNTLNQNSSDKGILEIVKEKLEKDVGIPANIFSETVIQKENWAVVNGEIQGRNKKDFDFTKTKYKDAYEEGVLDNNVVALLRKINNKWKVIEFSVGSTDFPLEYWLEKHKSAPNTLLTY